MNMDQAIAAAEVVEAHTEIAVLPEHDKIRPLLESEPESLLLAALLHLGHRVGAAEDPEQSPNYALERAMEAIADAYSELPDDDED